MEVEWGQWRRRRRRGAGLATIKDLSRLINPAQQCSQLLLVSMIICGLRFFTMAANNVTKLYTVIFFIPKHTDSSYGWQQCVGQLDFEFQIEFNFNFKSNTIRVIWLAAAVIENSFLVLHFLFFILNFSYKSDKDKIILWAAAVCGAAETSYDDHFWIPSSVRRASAASISNHKTTFQHYVRSVVSADFRCWHREIKIGPVRNTL